MEIRRANINDYNDIEKINKELQNIHIKMRPDLYQKSDYVLKFEDYKTKLAINHNYFLVCVTDHVVGYIYLILKENMNHVMKTRKVLFIDAIAVLGEFQGRGIGKEFINEAIKLAQSLECDSIELDVLSKNDEAINFYLKNNFSDRFKRMELLLK